MTKFPGLEGGWWERLTVWDFSESDKDGSSAPIKNPEDPEGPQVQIDVRAQLPKAGREP